MVSIELEAVRKYGTLKHISAIGGTDLTKREVEQNMERLRMFGILVEWKIDSRELKEELRAMHG